MEKWRKVARGAGLLAHGLAGNGTIGGRINAGLSGLELLSDAMKAGPPAARIIEVAGIADRCKIIAANIRAGSRFPPIVSLARRLVSKRCGDTWCVAPRDEVAMVEVIHGAMPDLVRWVKDPVGVDYYTHPRHTLADGGGDCDEEVAVEGSMLGAVGIPCDLIAAQEVGATDYSHIWLIALPDGAAEMHCDPTFETQPAGWSMPADRIVRSFRYRVWR